jgi:hypothetical protein
LKSGDKDDKVVSTISLFGFGSVGTKGGAAAREVCMARALWAEGSGQGEENPVAGDVLEV